MSTPEKIYGAPIDRVDGVAKVTGAATYAAELRLSNMCYAVIVASQAASGQVNVDSDRASRQPGVILVVTPGTAMRLPNGGNPGNEIPAGRTLTLLQDNVVHYNGQPVAMVIAESLEQATEAARLVDVTYMLGDAVLDFDQVKSRAHTPKASNGRQPDSSRGNFSAAIGTAAHRIDTVYRTPLEFHNPMEPHATVAWWQGGKLTLHDSTQGIVGLKKACAKVFGIDAEDVHTICPYTGGGFGSKGSMWSHVVLAAMAAKMTGRPVKLSLARTQMFFPVGHRPITEQHLILGADDQGRLTAMRHDTVSATSQIEDWAETCGIVTRMLYACPNLDTTHKVVPMSLGTPTFMRAPGEASGSFGLECAMDELAVALHVDPVELRLTNYTDVDPGENKPFSQKSLRECYAIGAECNDFWEKGLFSPGSTSV